MKKGFSGRAAGKYFQSVDQILREGDRCIQKGASFSAKMAGKSSGMSTGSGKPSAEEFERLNQKLLSRLSQEAVVVDEERYDAAAREQQELNREMTRRILLVIERMEGLCGKEYQIPSATPKVTKLLEEVRQNYIDSGEIPEELSETVRRYMNEIDGADR